MAAGAVVFLFGGRAAAAVFAAIRLARLPAGVLVQLRLDHALAGFIRAGDLFSRHRSFNIPAFAGAGQAGALQAFYFVPQSLAEMQLQQALADLAEVRGRLATVQRFDGYSSWAAIASGGAAIAAGIVQFLLVPEPHGAAEAQAYFSLWLGCLVLALAINYGAILAWRAHHRGLQTDAQIRTVGMSILPAIAAGGVITIAFVMRGFYDVLPAIWCATYALGLFASRAMVPRDVVFVAVAFGAFATFLLFAPHLDPLAWWVMPLAFGGGQIAIGIIVRRQAGLERSSIR